MTETLNQDTGKGSVLYKLFLVIFTMMVLICLFGSYYGWSCHIKASFSSDKYCYEKVILLSNVYSDSPLFANQRIEYYVRSHAQDKIDADAAEVKRIADEKAETERKDKIKECYYAGQYYNYTMDIIDDYGYTCPKLSYINDHFIDSTRQVDGGYIEGSSYGLFSYGHIKGQLYAYVTEGVLATGQLIEHIEYNLDCENSTLGPEESNCYYSIYYTYDGSYNPQMSCFRPETKQVDYYTESEFVMYYVDHCIT